MKTGDKVGFLNGRKLVTGKVEEVTGQRAVIRVEYAEKRSGYKPGDMASVVVANLYPVS